MIIKSLYLKNFKGTQKIANSNNEVYFEFPKEFNNIILIKGDNGLGKTTVLENLHPYSNMLSRDVKDSIIYPALKKIEILFNGDNYTLEVQWNDEKSTSFSTMAYIYKNGVKLKECEKGSITEFNYQVDRIFGEFDKFKSSVFLKQGSLEIIEAKPTERLNIIRKFMPSLAKYEETKNIAKNKENELKFHQAKLKEDIRNMSELKFKLKKVENDAKLYTSKILEKKEKEKETHIKKYERYLKIENEKENINQNILELKKENENLFIDLNTENEIKDLNQKVVDFDEKKFHELQQKIKFYQTILDSLSHYRNENISIFNENNFKNLKEDYETLKIKIDIRDKNIMEKNNIVKEINTLNNIKNSLEIDHSIKDKLKNIKTKMLEYTNIDFIQLIHSLKNQNILFANINNILETYVDKKTIFEDIKSIKFKYDNIKLKKNKIDMELNTINNNINTISNNIDNINIKISELKKSIIELPLEVYEEKNIKKYEQDILELNIIISNQKKYKENFNNIKEKNLCPTCFQEIDDKHKIHLKEEFSTLEENINKLKEYENQKKEYEEKFAIFNKNIKINENIINLNKEKSTLLEELEKNKNSYIKNEKEAQKISKEYSKLNDLYNIHLRLDNFSNIFYEYHLYGKTIEDIIKHNNEFITNNRSKISEYKNKSLEKDNTLKEFNKLNILLKQYKENVKKEEEINNSIKMLNIKIKSIVIDENIDEKYLNELKNKLSIEENNRNINNILNIFKKDFKKYVWLDIYNFKNVEELLEKVSTLNNKDVKNYIELEKTYNKNNELKNKIKELSLKLIESNKNIIIRDKNLSNINKLYKKLNNIKSHKYTKKDYEEFMKRYEEFYNDYNKWLIEKKDLELIYKQYNNIVKNIEELDKDIFQWRKIKLYSDKIKKSIIANTFENITKIANEILFNEEGTISLEISINQINDRKFEIMVKDNKNGNIINDISLLSGAEKMTVSKALSFALANNTNFKSLWLDESDSVLSKQNKQIFTKMLKKLFEIQDIEEIFIISHMDEIIDEADIVIDFNELNQNYGNVEENEYDDEL